jgi:hypothetical protein
MNPATRRTEGNASAPVSYMALELSNTSWRLAFGDGVKRRQGPRVPTRIEGGDERIALALSIEPGQPTQRPLVGKKMKRAM